MQRRTLLKMAALGGITAGTTGRLRALMDQFSPAVPKIHTVLLVTKCHLDVGFTMTQTRVIRKYFDIYFPAAIKIASDIRKAGPDRYVWTTGSWLLYEYLEQATPAERQVMETAIAAGDIDWHALPFSWQTEMVDRSMIEGSLGFSAELDRRFGHKTIGAKMTDVPGHSRGIVSPLQAAGVRLLDIGVNAASTPPDVPDVFLWKDTAGNSLAMLYHRHDYGSIVEIPGSGFAVDVEVRGDNSGPHTPGEIAAIYAKLRARFPGAEVKACSMNEVAAVVDHVRDQLPVVTAEIGDTWIYGCASDPYKIARYREIARLRKSWIVQGKFASGGETDRRLLGRLLLAPEHTWGTDTKTYLDDDHYRPTDLGRALDEPGYKVMEFSWKEKRDDIDEGVASLPHDLKSQVTAAMDSLQPNRPSIEGMVSCDPSQAIQTKYFTLAFDPATGAIIRMLNRTTGRVWASSQQPLALFSYQTLSAQDYAAYMQRYITIKTNWAPRDFGKPGIANFKATSAEWHPGVIGCWIAKKTEVDRIVLELAIEDAQVSASGDTAWPKRIFLEMNFPERESRIDLKLVTLGKVENRLPEAMWLTFAPADTQPRGWTLEKVDQSVDPLDVVRGGGRAMHAVSGAVRYKDADHHQLEIRTLDAPVVALGQRSPLNFSLQAPDLSAGIHFSLFNNAWGTNYPQWCGGDWSFRFQMFA